MADTSGVSELSPSQLASSSLTTQRSVKKAKRKPTKKKSKKRGNGASNDASNVGASTGQSDETPTGPSNETSTGQSNETPTGPSNETTNGPDHVASNEAPSQSNDNYGNNVEDLERIPAAQNASNDGPFIVNGSRGVPSTRSPSDGDRTPTPRSYASNPVVTGNGSGVGSYVPHGGGTYASESSYSMHGTISEPGYWYQSDGYYPHEEALMMYPQFPPRRNFSPSSMQNYPLPYGYHGYPPPPYHHGYGPGGPMMPHPGPYRPHGYRSPGQGYHQSPHRPGFHHGPHLEAAGGFEHGPAAATYMNPTPEPNPTFVDPTSYQGGSSSGEGHRYNVHAVDEAPNDGQLGHGVVGHSSGSPDTSSSATVGFESLAEADVKKDRNGEKQAAEPKGSVAEHAIIPNVAPEAISPNDRHSVSATAAATTCTQQPPQIDTSVVQVAPPTDSPVGRLALYSLLEILPLTQHLLSSFEAEQFSDLQIILTSLDDMFFPITFRVHRMIVSQSPLLASILQRNATVEKNSTIHLAAGKKFSLARAFETALQNMYGLPLVDSHHLKHLTMKALGWEGCPVQAESEKNKGATMDFAICYGASGALLHNKEILKTGFKLIHDLIGWDTVEAALHLGLFPDDFLVTYDGQMESTDTAKKGSKGKEKTKNSNDVNGSDQKQPQSVLHDTLNDEIKETLAPKVTTAALRFFVCSIPTAFHFDRLALTASLPDRIPTHLRTVSSGSALVTKNPKLAAVQFGSLGGAEPQPSRECSIASAILLALPFDSFSEALDIMRQNRVLSLSLVRAIVREREDRRLRALQAYAKKQNLNLNKREELEFPTDLEELGYQESVVLIQIAPSTLGGDNKKIPPDVIFHDFSLDRDWMGFETRGAATQEKIIRKKI